MESASQPGDRPAPSGPSCCRTQSLRIADAYAGYAATRRGQPPGRDMSRLEADGCRQDSSPIAQPTWREDTRLVASRNSPDENGSVSEATPIFGAETDRERRYGVADAEQETNHPVGSSCILSGCADGASTLLVRTRSSRRQPCKDRRLADEMRATRVVDLAVGVSVLGMA